MNMNREKNTILNTCCINPNKTMHKCKVNPCNSMDIKIWLLSITNVKKGVVQIDRA